MDALTPFLGQLSAADRQDIEDQLYKFQQVMQRTTIVGEAGAGLVKVISDGFAQPVGVEIDDAIFKETDKKLVSDLFVAAMKDNLRRCQENAASVEDKLRMQMLSKLRGLS